MRRHVRSRLLLSVVVMVAVLMVLGQMSVFAQAADPQAQAQLRFFLLFGGAYQLIEQAQGNCDGRCNFRNEWTGDCTCPEGWVALTSARMLVTVGAEPNVDTCGALLFICAK